MNSKKLLFTLLSLLSLTPALALQIPEQSPFLKWKPLGSQTELISVLSAPKQKNLVSSIRHTNSDIPVKYLLADDTQDKISALKYCKKVADKLNLSDVSFDLDSDKLKHTPYKDTVVAGEHNWLSKTVWLNSKNQKELAEKIKLGSDHICNADFLLLHELGHCQDHKKCTTLMKSLFLFEWLSNGAQGIDQNLLQNSPNARSPIMLFLNLGIIYLAYQANKYASECYADQFATKKLYEVHGFEEVQKYLDDNFMEFNLKNELGWGYQNERQLLDYLNKLHEQKKNIFRASI